MNIIIFNLEAQIYRDNIFVKVMIAGGRLKLGPKRKDSGFHRLHKLHQDGVDTENFDSHKIGLFDKHQNYPEQKETDKDTHFMQLGSPRNHLHLISNTPNIGCGYKNKVNTEIIEVPQKQNEKENLELEQMKQKNQELSTKISQLQMQKKKLEQMKQTNQELSTKISQLQVQKKELTEKLSAKTKVSTLTQTNETESFKQKILLLGHQNERLKNNQKRLEAELHNIDRNHYSRQISRLKSQYEKLQIEGLQNKHFSSLFHQQTQDHQKQMSKKSEELKSLMKQVEKQKMGLVEARNQFNEKERAIRAALEESEASNQVLCRNLEEIAKQLQREETLRKEKTAAAENLQQQIEILVARGSDSEAKCIKIRKNYEDQLVESNKKRLTIEEDLRIKNRQSEALIYRLSSDIERLKFQQTEQLTTSIVGELKQEGEQVSRGLKVVRLQEEINELQLSIQKKEEVIQTLETQLKEYFSPNQYQALERRCKQLQQKRLSSARYYQQKLFNYQKENDNLRLQKINKVNNAKEASSFDEIVKQTMEESENLRNELKRMSQVLALTKEQAAEIRQKEKGYLNELQILRKKTESSCKNFTIQLQVQKQKLTNEIDSLRRKLTTAETRLQYKISQNKQKDDFIKSVIVGRSNPLDRQAVMADLQIIFLEKEKKELKN